MGKFQVKIESYLGGRSPSMNHGKADQYAATIALDPYMSNSVLSTRVRASGTMSPTGYASFSGSEVDGKTKWIIKSGKDNVAKAMTYTYDSAGEFHAFSGTYAANTMETADQATVPNAFPITITDGTGNGGAYYNNYIYCANDDDIWRYGPLDTVGNLDPDPDWGSDIGLNKMGTDTYPDDIPNHAMHVHTDNQLYVCDFNNAAFPGQGTIHAIKTKKTTDQGDTDDGSANDVLDLPFGYMPIDIESWGTDLAILAMQTSDTVVNQGSAALFLWDPTDEDSFYRQIPLPDPKATALKNNDGKLYVFSGQTNGGFRVLRYLGGYEFDEEVLIEEGDSPLAGAVESFGDALVFPARVTFPETQFVVYMWGSKGKLPKSLQCIARAQGETSYKIYSLAQINQLASLSIPNFILGTHSTGTTGTLDQTSSTTTASLYMSLIFNVGEPFKITKLRIPFSVAIAANMVLTPTVYIDDFTSNVALTAINNTNDSGNLSKTYYPDNIKGKNNFLLKLKWSGTVVLPVQMPIIIEGETTNEEET